MGVGHLYLYQAREVMSSSPGPLPSSRAVWVSSIFTCINMVLVMLLGLVMYAYYVGCDPLASGEVEKKDQLIPLYVMAVMGKLPGLPGLFLATTFSASLRYNTNSHRHFKRCL